MKPSRLAMGGCLLFVIGSMGLASAGTPQPGGPPELAKPDLTCEIKFYEDAAGTTPVVNGYSQAGKVWAKFTVRNVGNATAPTFKVARKVMKNAQPMLNIPTTSMSLTSGQSKSLPLVPIELGCGCANYIAVMSVDVGDGRTRTGDVAEKDETNNTSQVSLAECCIK